MIRVLFLAPLCIQAIFNDYKIETLKQKNDWDAIERVYEERIKEQPHDAESLFNAGVAAFKKEQYDRAQSLFEQAVQLDEQFGEKATFNSGNCHMIQKKYQEALDAYEATLRYNPENIRARERAELARQMLQQPPQEDQKDNNSQKNNDNDKQDNQQESSNSDQPQDQDSKNQDQQKGDENSNDDSSREDAKEKSEQRKESDKQQEKDSKRQDQRGKENSKPEGDQRQEQGKGDHEKAQEQASQKHEDQKINEKNKNGDHSNPSSDNNTQSQSNKIDPKDQWKAQLFEALDKVEQDSHKDMMQVVYAAQSPRDQTPDW